MSDRPSGQLLSDFRQRNALLASQQLFGPERIRQHVVEVSSGVQ